MSSGRASVSGICGVLNVNKPTGVTSRRVVDLVARTLRRVKVGHAGTLDPLASGVLVVAVGPATRLIEYVQRMPKRYRTVVRLGARSDTCDADGRWADLDPASYARPDDQAVRRAVESQVGTILQKPPEFSALKVHGQRAYDLARAGKAVELEPRPVRIDAIELLRYDWPWLELEVRCGAGTYIRSIAQDVGDALGCGGLVWELTRTAIGRFALADALDPETFDREPVAGLLQPPAEMLGELPVMRLSADEVRAVGQGKSLVAGADRLAGQGGEVSLLGPEGELVAVAEYDPRQGRVSPRRVLLSES